MKPIFLIGFMGSGKTTLGKQLADKLKCPFVDSDREIEKAYSTTISQLFAEKGEMYFRELEKNFIDEVKSDFLQVVSVGGGLPCFNKLMDVLLQKGIVMYLRTTEQTLFKRLLNDLKERPLIEGMGEKELRSFIEVKLNEREKTYNQAHLIFDEVQSIETIIQEILLLQRN